MNQERKSAIVTLSILCFVILLVGLGAYVALRTDIFHNEPTDFEVTQIEGALPYTDLSGNTIDLSSFRGKPLIVNIWASWTPFSESELLLLSALKEQAGEELTILAINRKEAQSTAQSYIERIGLSSSIIVLLDADDTFFKSIDGYAMPETLFYDAKGKLIFHKRGVLTTEELREYSMLIKNERD